MLSCESHTPYDTCRENLVHGKELLERWELEEARAYFVKASEAQRLPEALVGIVRQPAIAVKGPAVIGAA